MIKKLLKKQKKIRRMNKKLKRIHIDNMPLFEQVEIETINRCNGECAFCPVNKNQPQREYARMTDELFAKIIDELSEINYKGQLCLSSNNEPFLDKRIIDFAKMAREKVPNAEIYMWTNGTIANYKMIEEIIDYLSYIYIDAYSVDNSLSDNIQEIFDYFNAKNDGSVKIYEKTHIPSETKISIFKRDQQEVLSSRGGQAPNKTEVPKISKIKCSRFFEKVIIRPDGKLSLCCCDALGKYTMGDVSDKTLLEIWNHSEEYKRLRTEMKKHGRKNIDLCRKCDFAT